MFPFVGPNAMVKIVFPACPPQWGQHPINPDVAKTAEHRLTNPRPLFQSAKVQGTNYSFGFSTVTGVTYQPQYSADLSNWKNLGAPITGTGAPISISDPLNKDASVKFYRVGYVPPAPH